ncbi:SnoaL-like domain protein [compost metagenome]
MEKAFDNWRTGKGSVYDFLADDAQWTIAGASLAAGTYNSKEEFFDKVIRPFNARVKSPLSPTIREIHTSGDTVVVLFDASTTANDGVLYKNTYAWFLQLRDGRVVKATAFFDTKWFDEFWIRVKPASAN